MHLPALLIALILFSASAFSQVPAYYNDQFYFKQWAFHSKDQQKSPGSSIELAHRYTKNWPRRQVLVAVIDTGVDYNHPDLEGKVWTNELEIPGNGIDDDHNGYIDDFYGVDLIDGDSDPSDSLDHGTHIAGIIAAVPNNSIGIAGAALSAKIMSIRAIPNTGDEDDQVVIEAFNYAAKMGANIINASFSKDQSSLAVRDTIEQLSRQYDILFVTTAGNQHRDIDQVPSYPASFQNELLVTVASCSQQASVSYFSSFGEQTVDLFAPGSIIYSLQPNNRYQSMNGTSQAAPYVSAMAAELYALFPKFSMLEIKQLLMESAIESNYLTGKSKTGGRVDLMNAINYALRR